MTATYLCFSPDEATARQVIRVLHHFSIDKHFIGLVAGTDLALDAISVDVQCQTWDTLDVVQRSIAIGGAPGIFAGLHAVSLPPLSTTLAGAAIFAADFARIGVAAVLSRALGKTLDADEVADIRQRLAGGEIMLIVRLSESHAEQIGRQLRRLVPLLRCEGNILATDPVD